MTRSHRTALLTLTLVGTVATTGCDHRPDPLVGLEDTQSLVAAVQEMSVDGVLDDLGLDTSQRAQVRASLESLHESMLALHALHPGDVSALSPEEKANLHARLQEEMAQVHELHHEFMETLSEEQKERFREHLHAAMEAHHDAAEGMHERHGMPDHEEGGSERHAMPDHDDGRHQPAVRHD